MKYKCITKAELPSVGSREHALNEAATRADYFFRQINGEYHFPAPDGQVVQLIEMLLAAANMPPETAAPAPDHIKDTLGMVKHIPDAGELVEDLADSLDYFIGWYEEDADLGNGPAFKFYDKAKKAITKYRQQEEAER